MNYCYARVSTEEQKLDRQIVAFTPYKPYKLYTDKETGKNFDRPEYQKMKKKLKLGDTLIVLSLDRFGRNYDQIKEEWSELSKRGVKIKIIDMPIIDTTANDLTSRLISDIVIQLLSYVAQTERENILKRQAQGIAAARARGVKFGRPQYKLPDHFDEIALKYQRSEITHDKAVEELKITEATFFKYIKLKGYSRPPRPPKEQLKNIDENLLKSLLESYKNREINGTKAAEKLNITPMGFGYYVRKYGVKKIPKQKPTRKPKYKITTFDMVKEFYSMTELSEELGVDRHTIKSFLAGNKTKLNNWNIEIIKL